MTALFVKDAFFFPLYTFGFVVKNQVFLGVWINVRVFNLIPLFHMSVFIPLSSYFDYYSPIVKLEVKDGEAFRSSFIVQDCLGYPGFFVITYEVAYRSFDACEKLCWDFNGDCIESVDYF